LQNLRKKIKTSKNIKEKNLPDSEILFNKTRKRNGNDE
jgi:hypothetical protein